MCCWNAKVRVNHENVSTLLVTEDPKLQAEGFSISYREREVTKALSACRRIQSDLRWRHEEWIWEGKVWMHKHQIQLGGIYKQYPGMER